MPVPASVVLRLAAGYHWNDYRTQAVGLAEPRRDRIWDGAITPLMTHVKKIGVITTCGAPSTRECRPGSEHGLHAPRPF